MYCVGRRSLENFAIVFLKLRYKYIGVLFAVRMSVVYCREFVLSP